MLIIITASLLKDLILQMLLVRPSLIFFPGIWGREVSLSCPYLECPRLPENTWLLRKRHLCEIIGCAGIRFIGSSGEGSSMQPWGGFLEEVALVLKEALS